MPKTQILTLSEPDRGLMVVTLGDAHIFDGDMIEAVQEHLNILVEHEGVRHLAVDLGPVRYLGSRLLGVLMKLHKVLKARGGTLELRHLCPEVRQTFQVSGLDKVLTIIDSAEPRSCPPPHGRGA